MIQKKKRLAPKTVAPLVHNGIRFEAPLRVGIVNVVDDKSERQLEQIVVYTITYDQRKEKDVQEVYINSLQIQSKNNVVTLIATDERDRTHSVDVSRFFN